MPASRRLLRRRLRAVAVTAAVVLAGSLAAPAYASGTDPAFPDAAPTSPKPRAGESTPRFEHADGAARLQTTAPSTFSARAAATVPGHPDQPLATDTTSTSVHLQWITPDDGGSPVIGYLLRLTLNGGVVMEAPWDESEVDIIQLDPDTTYEFSVAAVNSVGTGPYSTPVVFTTRLDYIERQFGADRYETSARVSYRAFPYTGIPAAFLANGTTFPDALAAAAAAGSLDGPVLLTRPDSIPTAISDELASLQPENVGIAGGTGAISPAVEQQAGAYSVSGAVRFDGADRYATAARIAQLWDTAPTVFLASGQDFPDALSGAAAAASAGAPVLLTRTATLPAATAEALARLKPNKIVVLGGAGAVSSATMAAAKAATKVATTTERWSGADRFATSAAVSKAAFSEAGVPVVYIANGMTFADALSGAAAAGSLGGPVLLTKANSLDPAVAAELARLKPERVVVLGGPSVVSESVVKGIRTATGKN